MMIKVNVSDGLESIPSLQVIIEGLGTYAMPKGQGSPIYLELFEGKWTLHVWSDINQEDATHRIDLSGALESERKGV